MDYHWHHFEQHSPLYLYLLEDKQICAQQCITQPRVERFSRDGTKSNLIRLYCRVFGSEVQIITLLNSIYFVIYLLICVDILHKTRVH